GPHRGLPLRRALRGRPPSLTPSPPARGSGMAGRVRGEAVSRLAIPRSLAELTRDWLTEALGAGTQLGPVRVSAAEVESIGRGTGLLCQLARVTLAYEPGAPAGPHTLVAKLP